MKNTLKVDSSFRKNVIDGVKENKAWSKVRFQFVLPRQWGNVNTFQKRKIFFEPLIYQNNTLKQENKPLPIVLDVTNRDVIIGTITIGHWSTGITWQLNVGGACETSRYLEQEPVPLTSILEDKNYLRWYLDIPKEVRVCLKPFTSYEFAILYLVSHYKYAYQLFISHPTLFWLMLCTAEEENVPEHKVLALMEKPRKDILGFCGLPPTKSALKVISKLKFFKYNQTSLGEIRLLFKNDDYPSLNHLKQIGSIVSPFINEFPELTNSRLLHGICNDNYEYTLGKTIDDIRRMATNIGITNIVERVGRCSSFDDVDSLHNNLVARLNTWGVEGNFADNFFGTDYPEPPIKGTGIIEPITNAESLFEEGVEQHHCVFTYHEDIVCGVYYVYKIAGPERATLGLFLKSGEKPELDQLYSAHNQDVSLTTRNFVLEWLKDEGEISDLDGNGT